MCDRQHRDHDAGPQRAGMATWRCEHRHALIIHSDRGVLFASWAFSQVVPDAGIATSMRAPAREPAPRRWRRSRHAGRAAQPPLEDSHRARQSDRRSDRALLAVRPTLCARDLHPPYAEAEWLTLVDERKRARTAEVAVDISSAYGWCHRRVVQDDRTQQKHHRQQRPSLEPGLHLTQSGSACRRNEGRPLSAPTDDAGASRGTFAVALV